MDGSSDPYASMRRTQAEMWPSARRTVLVGTNYYPISDDREGE